MTTLHTGLHPETAGWLEKARARDKAARAPTVARFLRLLKRAGATAAMGPLTHFGAYTYTADLTIEGAADVKIIVEVGHVRLWRDTAQIPVRKWRASPEYITGVMTMLGERILSMQTKDAIVAGAIKANDAADLAAKRVPGARMTVRQLREMVADLPDHMIVVVRGPAGRYMPADATATKAHCTEDGDLADYYGSVPDGTERAVEVLVIS